MILVNVYGCRNINDVSILGTVHLWNICRCKKKFCYSAYIENRGFSDVLMLVEFYFRDSKWF